MFLVPAMLERGGIKEAMCTREEISDQVALIILKMEDNKVHGSVMLHPSKINKWNCRDFYFKNNATCFRISTSGEKFFQSNILRVKDALLKNNHGGHGSDNSPRGVEWFGAPLPLAGAHSEAVPGRSGAGRWGCSL